MSSSDRSHHAETDSRLTLYPVLSRALRGTRDGAPLERTLIERVIEQTQPAMTVEEDTTLFRIADPASTVFVVQAGLLKGTVSDGDGREQVADFFLSGDFIDIQSFCTLRHQATVSAITTSRVVGIDLTALLTLARQNAPLQDALHRAVGRELLKLDSLLYMVGRKSVTARIASFYTTLARRFAEIGNSPTRFYFPALRADIASYLMMDPATFTRGIRQLENSALLRADGADVTLLDVAGLRNAAGEQARPEAD